VDLSPFSLPDRPAIEEFRSGAYFTGNPAEGEWGLI